MDESVIYHTYNPPSGVSLPVKPAGGGVALKLAKFLALTGLGLILFVYAPSFWYGMIGGIRGAISNFQLSKSEVESLATSHQSPATSRYQPRFDPTLPLESRIKIPSIGVDSTLQEATYDNYEEALKKGIWRVSDFGVPGSDRPVILAAHRFGYLAWTNMFRRKNSFYNLPKLKVGDTVEITWRQRKYIYEVYAEGKGEEITDYSANLILYTCEGLNGPVRIFKYARLLEI